jgi:hypothetical protein
LHFYGLMTFEHHYSISTSRSVAVAELCRSTKARRMKASAFFGVALLLLWTTPARSASDKAVLDIAPTLAELGNGWTTNQIVFCIDPRSEPPEQVYPWHPDPKSLLNYLRQMMQFSGRTGCLRMHYGFGDLTVNQGAYHVYLQRWESPETLSDPSFQESKRIDRPAPRVGQQAYWKRNDMCDGLVFRRDQYLVIIEFGSMSDYSKATRLAKVIDAKITGLRVPEAPELERQKDVEAIDSPNDGPGTAVGNSGGSGGGRHR